MDARIEMRKTKSISLIAAALLAISPVVASGITGETTVNAAKVSRHAKRHTKKNVKKHVKKRTRKTTKKRSKKTKKRNSDIEVDKNAKIYYRQVKANRYKEGKHWYVDIKANVANVPTLDEARDVTKYHIHNPAGEVFKVRTSRFLVYTDDDNGTVYLDLGPEDYFDLKNFTIVPKADGAKKNLADLMATSD